MPRGDIGVRETLGTEALHREGSFSVGYLPRVEALQNLRLDICKVGQRVGNNSLEG